MHGNYEDITSRILEAPVWYDQNGAPRFAPFHPNLCPNIYAHRVVLLRIACQECHREFLVEMHNDIWGGDFHPNKLHYGDPPFHAECHAGSTMNCEDLEVLEVWEKPSLHAWKRRPDLEGPMN
jgi:hypothetical protein